MEYKVAIYNYSDYVVLQYKQLLAMSCSESNPAIQNGKYYQI